MSARTGDIIATRESTELTTHDHRMRHSKAMIALHLGTAIAVVLAALGVQPVVCAMIPSMIVGIPTGIWSWRDLRALKRRRLAMETEADQTGTLS